MELAGDQMPGLTPRHSDLQPSPASPSQPEPEKCHDSSTHFPVFYIIFLPTQSDSLDQGQSSTANISVSFSRNTEVSSTCHGPATQALS